MPVKLVSKIVWFVWKCLNSSIQVIILWQKLSWDQIFKLRFSDSIDLCTSQKGNKSNFVGILWLNQIHQIALNKKEKFSNSESHRINENLIYSLKFSQSVVKINHKFEPSQSCETRKLMGTQKKQKVNLIRNGK